VSPDTPGVHGALLFFSLAPALAYLAFTRWLDRYDREPWHLVLGAFFWGATGGVIGGAVSTLILAIPVAIATGGEGSHFFNAVFLAPPTEEFAKGVFLLVLAFHKQFDGVIDGMVYGAAVGLGFAFVENYLYFWNQLAQNPAGLGGLIFLRTIFTMVGHGVATACTGAALGAAKFSTRHPVVRLLMCLVGLGIATVAHALGNMLLLLSTAASAPVLVLLDLAGLAGALGLHLLVMQLELRKEAATIREQLSREPALLSTDDVALVASYSARVARMATYLLTLRWGRAWRLHRVCQTATHLALRRQQAATRPKLQADVSRLEARLEGLVGGSAL
jgi:RsiW-degrading membrane proteinase PrsW (M82 family)